MNRYRLMTGQKVDADTCRLLTFWSDRRKPGGKAIAFNWKRKRVYHFTTALVLYEICLENGGIATVVSSSKRCQRKTPDFFINGLAELVNIWNHCHCQLLNCKRYEGSNIKCLHVDQRASRFLHLPSEKTMGIAETLYLKGYISYPRTETEKFSSNFDARSILSEFQGNEKVAHHSRISSYETNANPLL